MALLSQARLPRSAEWVLLIAIVLVAALFRFAQFGQVPPGLHYDEAIDAKLAQDVRSGAWSIYFEEGWGREPLYHYLVAAALNFVPEPASALRVVSGLLGLVQLLAAYFLSRRLFGVPTALIGAAWMAVLFWSVSTSRAGLRNISLSTFTTLTALAFWSVWSERGLKPALSPALSRAEGGVEGSPDGRDSSANFILPGLLLGLTLYTYQPSRVVPLIYLGFFAYLLLLHRTPVKARWTSLAIFLMVAAVLAAPLGIFLATHPYAETGRAFQTEPIRALLNGDPSQVVETAMATLKMFAVEGGGDPQPIYNVPGRPLFVGLGALLFYLGLLACLARWRQPAYAFALIWLSVTLLPNLLTSPAPFFYRAIAAQTPVSVLPAMGAVALGDWIRKGIRLRATITIAIAVLSLGQTAWTTQHDYFVVWGTDPGVRFQYSAAHTAIARALDDSTDSTPVAVSGLFIEDADPYIFEQTLRRRDLSIRWFDARSALVAVADAADQRIALPAFTPLHESLLARFLADTQPVTRTKDFAIYSFDAAAFKGDIASWSGLILTLDRETISLPISFDGNLLLLGYERPAAVARVEPELALYTAWRVTGEGRPSSTAIFAHLIGANGDLVAQDDRLGFPHHNWHADDELVQVHRIPIGDVPPGTYTLQIGLYTRSDGTRWPARDAVGNPIGDRVLLGQIQVTP